MLLKKKQFLYGILAAIGGGIVTIHTEAPLEQHSKLSKMLHEYAETVPDAKDIRVHSRPT